MKTRFYTFLILLIFHNNLFSQLNESKRANYWHFGNQAGIHFDCSPVSFSGSQLNSLEGSASISDKNGNLLFYTNGETVWDRNNNVMPNGTGLLGDVSTVQSAIIIPHPGDSMHYFIFTAGTSIEDSGMIGVRYSEVDMNLNGGNGDVLPANKNTFLFAPNEEKLTGVINATNDGYWVAAQEKSSNKWYVYEVTNTGVNMTPVISITGPNARVNNSLGAKFSPDGTLLVTQNVCGVGASSNANLTLYSFDNATGQISYLWSDCGTPGFNLEFSPDGTKLYAAGSQMYQYDLTAGAGITDSTAIIASKTQLTSSSWTVDALQLANDCKIYVAEGGTSIGKILNPNAPGLACNYVPGSFILTSGTTGQRFPNFVQSFFNAPCTSLEISVTGNDASCINDGSASVNVIQGQPQYTYSWSTGDTTQTITNIGGGVYYVTVSDASGCTKTDSILINQPQTATITSAAITNLTTCTSNDGAIDISVSLGGAGNLDSILVERFETDGQGVRYTANPYPGTPSTSYFFMRGDDASINFTTNPTGEEGSYYYGARRTGIGSLPANCDVTLNSINISGYTNLEMCAYLALGRSNMNVDANTRITLEYNIDGTGWNTLMDFRQPSGFPAYNLAEDTDGDGVGDGITLSTAFQDFCYPIPGTGNNIQLRVSTNASGSSLRQTAFDYIRLKGTPPFSYSYLWSTGDTTQDINNLADGTYWVQITGSNGCVVSDTFIVTSPCTTPTLEASFNLTNNIICEGDSITFTDNSTGTISSWNWTFNGGSPNSSNTQGPHTITFNNAGSYNINLQVSDGTNTDDTTTVITVLAPSYGSDNITICSGDSVFLGGAYQTSAGNYIDTLFNANINGCDSILTTTLNVNPSDTAIFSYSATNYCLTDPNPIPNITGTTGGLFSIDNGGVINANTGEIDISTSGVGNYTITYTTQGICPDSSTFSVNIVTSSDATITQAGPFCSNDPSINLTAATPGGFWSGVGITDTINGTFDPGTAGTGSHVITYTIYGSCGDMDTMTIVVNSSEDATFNYPNNTFCQTDTDPSANITGTIGGTFTSSPSGLSINSSTGLIDLSASTPGTYGVLYTTPGITCQDTHTVYITINASDDASFSYPNTTFCQSDPDPIANVTGTNGGTFTSSPSGLSLNSNTGLIDLSASTPGTYGILYTTPNVNCQDTHTVYITINASDIATFNYNSTTFCISDPNPIPNITGTAGGLFSINNNGSINVNTGEIDLITTGAGTFTVTYVTSGLCPDSSSINITINNESDATITPIGTLCSNDGIVNLSAVDGGGTWSGTGIVNSSLGTFDPSIAGTGNHQIIYTISGNCGDSDTINITVNQSPFLTLITTDDICYNGEGNIESVVSGGISPYTYLWDNGETTSSISNLFSGQYTLIVTDSAGCSSTSSSFVDNDNTDCDFHVFLPNIFSPNGDNHNDIFIVRGEGIKTISLVVYSRWGEKVFETTDPNVGWDGTYKGEDMNPAVFVYYLKATMINNEIIEKQGNVTLVR